MALTRQCRGLLDRFEQVGVLPFDRMSVLEARESVAASRALQGERVEMHRVEDLLAPGPAGRLPVRVYVPTPAAPPALVVYFHGGGWTTGSVEVADLPCRMLAAATGCVVASVEYRLSPETQHPGPTEDCFAATRWLTREASRWQAPPDRTVVCGDSAGGGLAAAVTLMARDRGGPAITAQVLLYPALAPARDSRFASYQDNADGYGLTRAGMEWFWDHYLATPAHAADPYAAPLNAPDLSGLPPALVVLAEHDVLRDEGLAYAARLRSAEVDVETLVYPGLIHGFFWMGKALDEGRAVHEVIARRLRSLLGPAPPR